MNTEDQNQDFAKLQQLLKLKRYEAPPPRYFNDFSGKVVSRIRAGKTGDRYDAFENIVEQTPWLNRLWRAIESQPALSGAVAVIACCLMVAGVFLTEKTTPQNVNFTATSEGPQTGNAGNDSTTPLLGNNLATTSHPGGNIDTASALPGPNLFEHLSSLRTAPPLVDGMPIWQRPQTNPAALLFR